MARCLRYRLSLIYTTVAVSTDRAWMRKSIRFGLTADEKADLVAFLQTLSGKPAPVQIPELPR
jgi:hypothetical protein